MIHSEDNNVVILIDSDSEESSSDEIHGAATAHRNAALGTNRQIEIEMNGDGDGDSCSLSSASACSDSVELVEPPSVSIPSQRKSCDSIVDLYACGESSDVDCDSRSHSSSSSSGIPSPSRLKTSSLSSLSSPTSDFPPSVIHTTSPAACNALLLYATKAKPAKKKSLTNGNKTILKEDDASCTDMDMDTDMSTTSSLCKSKSKAPSAFANQSKNAKENASNPVTATATNQRKKKKRQWGYSKKKTVPKLSDRTNESVGISSLPSTVKRKSDKFPTADDGEVADKHFHCYLLRSLDPNHPLKTYIGYTTNPQRRIRQHNGTLKGGGAHRTKKSGRPWTFVCVIHGFQDKITAMQFEWAWQNVDKSLGFREAVGDDTLARKMKRRHGPKNRLEELRILLKECMPFCLYSLTVYFPEKEYHDIFSAMLRRGKDGNPCKKDNNESELYESLMKIELCSLENMPVARGAAELKDKKKAKKEGRKQVQEQQKSSKEKDYSPDFSDWLERAKSVAGEECCLSDLLDDDDDDDDDDDAN